MSSFADPSITQAENGEEGGSGSKAHVGYQIYLRRNGRTPNGHLIWSEAELKSLHETWPDAAAHLARYPHRTADAYVHRGRLRGLKMPSRRPGPSTPWTAREISTLKKLYPTATKEELRAALPGRTKAMIALQVRYLRTRGAKLVRPVARTQLTGSPVINALLRQARARNLTLADLDGLIGGARYFSAGKHRQKKVNWTKIVQAAELVDGTISISFASGRD